MKKPKIPSLKKQPANAGGWEACRMKGPQGRWGRLNIPHAPSPHHIGTARNHMLKPEHPSLPVPIADAALGAMTVEFLGLSLVWVKMEALNAFQPLSHIKILLNP